MGPSDPGTPGPSDPGTFGPSDPGRGKGWGVDTVDAQPPQITAAANRVFNTVLQQTEVRQTVEQTQAGEVVGGTPEEFAAFIRGQTERWAPVIRAAGIKAD